MSRKDIEARVEGLGLGAVMVAARTVRRVIKRDRELPGIGMEIPHAHVYVARRDVIARACDAEDLGRDPASLPDVAILIPRVEDDDPASDREAEMRLRRALYHGVIHRELERKMAAGELPDRAIRGRIHAIGQTEFDEIRFVLRQDALLLPPRSDASTYVEFAATFLELRAFSPEEIGRTFPAIAEPARVEAVLCGDVDAPGLLRACRKGAPEAAPHVTGFSEHPGSSLLVISSVPDSPLATMSSTLPPPAAGDIDDQPPPPSATNIVRSIVTGARPDGRVEDDVRALVHRLAQALELPPTHRAVAALLPVALEARRRARWSVESRILYDLQKVCVDHERELFTVDVIEFLRSFGKRAVRRPIPLQRAVRKLGHLRAAQRKIVRARIPMEQRRDIARLLRDLMHRAESLLRRAARPHIEAALEVVGLRATNLPERVAAAKLVDELCDTIARRGAVSLPELRDALSRNDLKMPNTSPRDLVYGDALLRADAELAVRLDGVYRRGEAYLRLLQLLSSLPFGTRVGRVLSLYVLLPALVAFVALEGVQHMVGPLVHKLLGFEEPKLLGPTSLIGVAAFVFAMVHVSPARKAVVSALRLVGQGIRAVVWDGPKWLFTRPIVKAIFASTPVRAFGRYVIEPALFVAAPFVPLYFVPLDWPIRIGILAALFLFVNVFLNTRAGRRVEETVVDFATRQARFVTKRVLPGILKGILDGFRRMVELLERGIYKVDEFLRFREGSSSIALVVKGALGVVWFFVTYLIRFYVNLLIEPQVNPIKHFPVVTVAHKILIPLLPAFHGAMTSALRPAIGVIAAEAIAAPTVFLLPGFFGFLVWELKENWRLFQQNHRRELGPVLIGDHGETMVAFMKPGFHSGTVPKLYMKMRRAQLKGRRAQLKHDEALHHVQDNIHDFAERSIVRIVNASACLGKAKLKVGDVAVASNRVTIDLACESYGQTPARLAFECQSGWLVGSVARLGWIEKLEPAQRAAFEVGLAGLYKTAGVDLVREHITAAIGEVPYDIDDGGLVVWPDGDYATEVVYGISSEGSTFEPRPTIGRTKRDMPVLSRGVLFFNARPITSEDWVGAWGELAGDVRSPASRSEALTRSFGLLPSRSAPIVQDPKPATPRERVATAG